MRCGSVVANGNTPRSRRRIFLSASGLRTRRVAPRSMFKAEFSLACGVPCPSVFVDICARAIEISGIPRAEVSVRKKAAIPIKASAEVPYAWLEQPRAQFFSALESNSPELKSSQIPSVAGLSRDEFPKVDNATLPTLIVDVALDRNMSALSG
jgi:hypothetical protein